MAGSRIAYGDCYDRNDNPEEYCLKYQDGNGTSVKENICDEDSSVKSDNKYCK